MSGWKLDLGCTRMNFHDVDQDYRKIAIYLECLLERRKYVYLS